jgi:hypothetical protein
MKCEVDLKEKGSFQRKSESDEEMKYTMRFRFKQNQPLKHSVQIALVEAIPNKCSEMKNQNQKSKWKRTN